MPIHSNWTDHPGRGTPCQGVSGLNSERRGALKDHRSRLYTHVDRIEQLVRQAFPWAQVHRVAESVQSMDQADREVMSASFGQLPWAIDAAGISMSRRPRLYWTTWELLEGEGVTITPPGCSSWGDYGTVSLQGEVRTSDYPPGWTRLDSGPFPTFTTARPRSHPGRRPAGLHLLSDEERAILEQDLHRFPPYQYQWQHQVCNVQGRATSSCKC